MESNSIVPFRHLALITPTLTLALENLLSVQEKNKVTEREYKKDRPKSTFEQN